MIAPTFPIKVKFNGKYLHSLNFSPLDTEYLSWINFLERKIPAVPKDPIEDNTICGLTMSNFFNVGIFTKWSKNKYHIEFYGVFDNAPYILLPIEKLNNNFYTAVKTFPEAKAYVKGLVNNIGEFIIPMFPTVSDKGKEPVSIRFHYNSQYNKTVKLQKYIIGMEIDPVKLFSKAGAQVEIPEMTAESEEPL